MHRVNFNAALRHHPRGHRAVDSARKKRRCLSAGARRHSSEALAACAVGIYICLIIAYFNANRYVRALHVNRNSPAPFQDCTAHVTADFRRFERKFFVAALGFHLKGFCKAHIFGNIIRSVRKNNAHILFENTCLCDEYDSENLFELFLQNIRIGAILRLDIDNRLRLADRFNQFACRIFYIFYKEILKAASVKPFENYFSVFDQNYFLHLLKPFTILFTASQTCCASSIVL